MKRLSGLLAFLYLFISCTDKLSIIRTYFSLFIILFFASNLFGQKIKGYQNTLDILLNEYDSTYAIQDTLLNQNIATAFNYLIFSNSDLTTHSSSFGYTQNKEKTTISANANLRIGKNSTSRYYLRIGANASGSKNIFQFYDNDSWSNNASLNIGVIRKTWGAGVYFNDDEAALLRKKRKIYAYKPIYLKNKYNQSTLKAIDSLKQDINDIFTKEALIANHATLLELFPEIKKLIDEKKYEEAYSLLDIEEKKIKPFSEALEIKDKCGQKKIIKNKILYNFDKENDITQGYNVKWFELNLNLGNSTYKFTDESIDEEISETFSNVFNIADDINKLKAVLSLNYNQTINKKNIIYYYQTGVSATLSSFLENVLIDGNPTITSYVEGEYILQDEDNQYLGNFNKIKKDFATGSIHFYGAIFLTKNKNFGLNLSLKHNYRIDKLEDVFYKNNFTTLFGPIFRKINKDQTSLTFGIDLGWENAIYGTKISDDFTGRIRVGIPFKIYTKKKKEEESN